MTAYNPYFYGWAKNHLEVSIWVDLVTSMQAWLAQNF